MTYESWNRARKHRLVFRRCWGRVVEDWFSPVYNWGGRALKNEGDGIHIRIKNRVGYDVGISLRDHYEKNKNQYVY